MVAVQFIFILTLLKQDTIESKALYDASSNFLGVNRMEEAFIQKTQDKFTDRKTQEQIGAVYFIGNVIKNQQLNLTWTF